MRSSETSRANLADQLSPLKIIRHNNNEKLASTVVIAVAIATSQRIWVCTHRAISGSSSAKRDMVKILVSVNISHSHLPNTSLLLLYFEASNSQANAYEGHHHLLSSASIGGIWDNDFGKLLYLYSFIPWHLLLANYLFYALSVVFQATNPSCMP